MATSILAIVDANNTTKQLAVETNGSVLTPHSVPEVAGLPVTPQYGLPTIPQAVTYAAPSGASVLTLGGTSQIVQAAGATPVRLYIKNGLTAAEQGIGGAEAITLNIGSPAVIAGAGLNIPIEPGGDFTIGPTTQAISWNAATTGHKITAIAIS